MNRVGLACTLRCEGLSLVLTSPTRSKLTNDENDLPDFASLRQATVYTYRSVTMANDLTDLIEHYRKAVEALKTLGDKCREHSFVALGREADECREIITERCDAFNFMLAKRSQKPLEVNAKANQIYDVPDNSRPNA